MQHPMLRDRPGYSAANVYRFVAPIVEVHDDGVVKSATGVVRRYGDGREDEDDDARHGGREDRHDHGGEQLKQWFAG